ncbi:MAG TPA: hypothetical protein VFP76_01935 [Gemmatimonadota bacterium]|nr:hypothetical protein [Gemmatimonadota bacterium]
MTRDTLDAARQALTDSVIDLPGVAGVGIGECDGRPCLKVFIERRSDELEALIPRSMEGIPVDIEVTGEIRPLEPD